MDRRCTTRRLRIQKGIKGREGQNKMVFLFLGGGFVGFCRRRLELLLSWFNSLLAF